MSPPSSSRAADGALRHATLAVQDNGVATVQIRDAGALNILSSAVMEDLREAIDEAGADPALRVLILRSGNDEAFIAGADVFEMVDLDEQTAGAFIQRLHDLCEAVRRCPVPVIARLSGICLGGGLQLAAACDLRIAATQSRFGMPEVRVGMASIGHSALLPALCGGTEARWLLLTGQPIGSDDALRCGLVSRVVQQDQLDPTIAATVDAILACGPLSVRTQKQLLRQWETQSPAQAIAGSLPRFAEAYASGEPQRYLQAFIARRSG